MDISEHLDLKPAPAFVFDSLTGRAALPRFMVRGAGGWSKVTWGEYAAAIRRTACWLSANGLRPGDRAAVFAPNSVEWACAALGIQAAGGVMVPIYASSTRDQASHVLDHSDARFVFADTPPILETVAAIAGTLPGLRVVSLGDGAGGHGLPLEGTPVKWSDVQAGGEQADRQTPDAFRQRLASIDVDAPGLMLYTSGTTGNPKGVPLTHRNVGSNGRDWLLVLGEAVPENGVDVLWLPMSHVFGFGELCIGNALGFTTWMSSPYEALDHLREVRPTVFMSVPSLWEKLAAGAAGAPDIESRRARLAEATGGRLRFCLSGGAGLERRVKELYESCGLLIIEGYGLTEASPTLTMNSPRGYRFDSVGRPFPSVELRLADDGEILARGPNVFAGYHKDPESTRATFTPDGWLKTGDLGRFTDDGFLQIVGRKKEILVTAGGKNIPPENIELRFRGDPLVDHVVVYGDGRRYLVAGVWPNAHAALGLDRAELCARIRDSIDRVNSTLARHETIKKFEIMDIPLSVESGMLTPTLKVKRQKVYSAYRERFESMYD